MNKLINYWIAVLICFANIICAQPVTRGTSSYIIDVTLDEENKMLIGQSTIKWTNPSDSVVDHLQFHLYYNAFKNTASSFMKDRNNFGFLMESLKEECGWSYVEIIELTDQEGNDLIQNAFYIAPDDGNQNDQTVLQVPVVQPVVPLASQEYKMKWRAKIPKAMIRTGYNQDYYFFAQWFPKLGVYEPAGMRYEEVGAWNCHQYHANGEYYGEFGDYDVTMDVPSHFVVGSSGSLVDVKANGDRKRYTYSLSNVIDFTWTCSPNFLMLEDQWRDVSLQLFTYPGHEIYAERYFTTIKQAMTFMDEHVGRYPYKSLTMVDPPLHGLFTGGMEYPTLISSISSKLLPKGVKAPETLVVHEFVHQYFMQMIATHEQEEPWMDEGITTYYEGRILDQYYGEKTSLLDVSGVKLGNREYNRYEFWASDNPKIADNSYKAREFVHGGYGTIAYNKTAMMLKTLEGILGIEKMDAVMKSYFETWKFNHPCGLDFLEVFTNEVSSDLQAEKKLDLELFFRQALYGSVTCDYRVRSITSLDQEWMGGYFENTDECITYQKEPTTSPKQVVILERLGELILPIDVQVVFDNGEEKLFLWDGKSRSKEFIFDTESTIKLVQLDPEQKIDLERDLINNSLKVKDGNAYKKYTSKFKVGMQHLLDFLNFLS